MAVRTVEDFLDWTSLLVLMVVTGGYDISFFPEVGFIPKSHREFGVHLNIQIHKLDDFFKWKRANEVGELNLRHSRANLGT